MIMTMKSQVLIALAILSVSVACKVDLSSASPNGNSANANTQVANAGTGNDQQQSNCALTKAVAPVLNGLRLGMTPDEVLALFPGSKADDKLRPDVNIAETKFGNSSFIVRPSLYETKENFKGIRQITFAFLDSRVSSINIGYEGPAYPHVDQFVTRFVEGTSLPPADQWQGYVGLDNQLKILTCKDFEVRVFAGGEGGNLNYVLLTDLEADKKLKERRAKAKAQATPSP